MRLVKVQTAQKTLRFPDDDLAEAVRDSSRGVQHVAGDLIVFVRGQQAVECFILADFGIAVFTYALPKKSEHCFTPLSFDLAAGNHGLLRALVLAMLFDSSFQRVSGLDFGRTRRLPNQDVPGNVHDLVQVRCTVDRFPR